MFIDLLFCALRPLLVTWWLESIDYVESLFRYGFGTLTVDTMFWDLRELVEGGRVEVDELGARCRMREKSGQSGGIPRR